MVKDTEEKVITVVEYPGEDGSLPTARYNVALDEAKLGDDGFWEVIRTVKQIVTFDNQTWYIREKAVKSIDKNFTKASRTTHTAIGHLLEEYSEDFFSKGEWDGHQYVMETKDLNKVKIEEHHGIIEDVSNTKA